MKSLKRADYFAVIAILILAAAIFYSGTRGANGQVVAVIKQNNAIIRKVSLNANTQLRIEDGDRYNEISISNGKIAVQSASCRHQTCVQSGWIGRAGQVIVCLENRVSITIEGQGELDAVVK